VACTNAKNPFAIQFVLYYNDPIATLSMFFHPLQIVMVLTLIRQLQVVVNNHIQSQVVAGGGNQCKAIITNVMGHDKWQ
jgi:hypothetical protein